MRELVMSVLNISGQAAIIFVVLLVMRGIFALARVPKKYAYGLWAILFVRLLLPVQLEARWGLMPQESGLVRAVENMVDANGQRGQDALENMAGDVQFVERQDISADEQSMFGGGQAAQLAPLRNVTPQAQEFPSESNGAMVKSESDMVSAGLKGKNTKSLDWMATGRTGTAGQRDLQPMWDIGSWQLSIWAVIVGIWIIGSVLFMGYGVFSYFNLKRKLCCSLRLEGWGEGIYLADGIETPFALGFIAPRIYLPSNMAGKNYPYVIAHERVHVRRRDYLFKLGAYLLTCLYWFHPLVWAGFILMGRDMEMSCDEAVLRRMNGDCREAYADSLLQLTCGRHYPAAPLAFGEGDTKGRIKHIMGYRKAAAAIAIVAVALTGILAAVLLTSPQETEAEDGHFPQMSSLPEEDGQLPQDSASLEPTGDKISGRDTETADNGNQFLFQVAYRDVISCPRPVMTGNTFLGADGVILDYVDEDKVIFHGCFGLYVYSASEGKTIGAVDLRALGCGYTQGDNACQVLVNRDGSQVYFYPLGGIDAMGGDQEHTGLRHRITSNGEPVTSIMDLDQGESEHAIYSYVYDVRKDKLRIVSWNLGQSGDSYEEIDFSQLMGEELSECREVPVAEREPWVWEHEFCSCYGMVFEKDGEQIFGYLKSASETLEDLVYMQRPLYVYGENELSSISPEDDEEPGAVEDRGDWRKAVQLFGANGQRGSTAFYDRREALLRITIDGTVYDLDQVMTEYRVGDEIIESPQGNHLINAIVGLQSVDGFWVVEGHINPSRGTYSFYDPVTGDWICHIVGSCLTWSRGSRNERLPLWEGNRESLLSTVIYALDNTIYSLQDGKLAFLSLEESGQDEANLLSEEAYGLHQDRDGVTVEIRSVQTEEICGLYREEDEITVEIRSTQTNERRTVQFPYMRAGSAKGIIKLE